MHHCLAVVLAVAVARTLALPHPQTGDSGENDGPVGGPEPPTPTVTASRGSLRGDSCFLEGNAPLPDPDMSDSAIVLNPGFVNDQGADAKLGLYLDFNSAYPPQPVRGDNGATDPGPRTHDYEKLNPDLFAPPGTDADDMPNLMWPMGLSHNRPGTDMRLLPMPIGDFTEDGTFLVSKLFLRNPVEVLSKGLRAGVGAFKDTPKDQLYIFNGTPAPKNISKQSITSSAGSIHGNGSITYHWSQQKPFEVPGGSIKILDPATFPVAKMFSPCRHHGDAYRRRKREFPPRSSAKVQTMQPLSSTAEKMEA
ncbi:hypothetical protein QBC41DRAFT_337915 [Cercophora samala]|uniref:Uncharacterized protein n=1 Tax=Cercophora samala TaxID=330535 RepID=A0AA40DAP5_9PEZI|nr:hypothetical protein QBC41DRAFT_337915 [Cercophora samala]